MCGALMSFKQVEASMITSKELFLAFFLGELASLKNDRVVNVRMSLSDELALHHKKYPEHSLILQNRVLNQLV
jgi:hypothetical protein